MSEDGFAVVGDASGRALQEAKATHDNAPCHAMRHRVRAQERRRAARGVEGSLDETVRMPRCYPSR